MKKWMQRATAAMLVLAAFLSLTVGVTADSEKKKLVCLGDGVAAGLGMLADYDGKEYEKSPLDKKAGAVLLNPVSMYQAVYYGYSKCWGLKITETPTYPRQVAEILGYEYVDLTCTGICLTDVCAMLKGEESPQENMLLDDYLSMSMGALKGMIFSEDSGTEAYQYYSQHMREEIKDASVVVLSLGLNDVTLKPIYNLLEKSDEKQLTLADFLQATVEGNAELLEKFPEILKSIKSINSHCKIIMTGVYNPLAKVTLTGDDGQTLASFSQMLTALNASFAVEAAACGASYVDITGTQKYLEETKLDINDLQEGGDPWNFFKQLLSIRTHPGLEGHTYIAEQILKKFDVTLQNGTFMTYLGGTKVGEMTYRRSALSWTIQTPDGRYINCGDNGVTLANSATKWKYDGGFYCKKGEKVKFLGFLTITKYTKQYLTFDGEKFGLSSDKVTATLYKVD